MTISLSPELSSPMPPLSLAHRFVIGYRTDRGMWCQTFAQGWPKTEPFLLREASPVGLLTAAELDPQWFTGLPFGRNERDALPSYPRVELEWHIQDDLPDSKSLTPEGVLRWL
jgi:hypothetical protein